MEKTFIKVDILKLDVMLYRDNVIIANHVALVGKYDHNYLQIGTTIRLASAIKDKDYSWIGLKSKIIIEDDVWIGYGAIIMSGVKIEK